MVLLRLLPHVDFDLHTVDPAVKLGQVIMTLLSLAKSFIGYTLAPVKRYIRRSMLPMVS